MTSAPSAARIFVAPAPASWPERSQMRTCPSALTCSGSPFDSSGEHRRHPLLHVAVGDGFLARHRRPAGVDLGRVEIDVVDAATQCGDCARVTTETVDCVVAVGAGRGAPAEGGDGVGANVT